MMILLTKPRLNNTKVKNAYWSTSLLKRVAGLHIQQSQAEGHNIHDDNRAELRDKE